MVALLHASPDEIPLGKSEIDPEARGRLSYYPNDATVKNQLEKALFEKCDSGNHSASLNDQIYQTIKIQLQALNLVSVQYLKTTGGGMGLFWSLTNLGNALMMSLRTVKTADS